MASGSTSERPNLHIPDFIRFLFSSKPKFDCYFQVGNESQGKPERVGAVKLMLMAHSEVFRLELEDSELRERKDVPITDVHPDTFKGMLKFVYGYDTITDMSFEEADNMLYVAEKYMINTLKNKLATRLKQLLNTDNICSLLNNPACYTHLELNSAITKILRYETDRVLASPQFVLMNAEGFLKILEQDGLAVAEIELWRAAIEWAKHRAGSEDGRTLRQQLSTLSPHLRLCTLTGDEFCTEVANTAILTAEEVTTVCTSIGNKQIVPSLGSFSNETKSRKLLKKKWTSLDELMALSKLDRRSPHPHREYTWELSTKKQSVELLTLVCRASHTRGPDRVECTTTITKVDGDSAKKKKFSEVMTFAEDVERGFLFEIPMSVDGRNLVLLPKTKYTVNMKVQGGHYGQYSFRYGGGSHENAHLKLTIPNSTNRDHAEFLFELPFQRLQYRISSYGEKILEGSEESEDRQRKKKKSLSLSESSSEEEN